MACERIGLLGVHSPRTTAYLRAMIEHQLPPTCIILLSHPQQRLLPGQTSADPASILAMAERAGIAAQMIPTMDVNDPRVATVVASRPESTFLYSGAGGAILRQPLLSCGKRFLHIHPGLVPHYRGSTPMYYSILKEGSCGASAIFLTEQIDRGPVIRTKRYPLPEDGASIDYVYDPDIRADLLVEVLEEYRRTGTLSCTEQSPEQGETYYIVHPVLKHLAILACEAARMPAGVRQGSEP